MIDIDKLRQALGAVQPEEVEELLDRLEAAESALSNLGVTPDEARDGLARHKALMARLEAAEKERDAAELMSLALRAKIEKMEKQEPVAFALYSGWAFKAVYHKEHEACDQRDRRQLSADLGGSLEAYRVVPLFTLPGAQPAPSIPDDVMRDAKRYRFLRAAKNIPISTEAARDPIVYDAAIDAAMLARAPEAKP